MQIFTATTWFVQNAQYLAKRFGVSDIEELHSEEFHQIIPLFNIMYYLCMCPFRIKKTASTIYKIHTNKIQQIVTLTFNAVVVWYTYWTTEVTFNFVEKPQKIFATLEKICVTLETVVGIFIFWRHKFAIENLLKTSQKNRTNARNKTLPTLMGCFIVIWLADLFTFYVCFIWKYGWRNITEIHQDINKLEMFGLDRSKNITFAENVFSAFTVLTAVYKDLFYTCSYLSVIICSYMMHKSSQIFVKFLKNENVEISKIPTRYKHVRDICECINRFVAFLVPLQITRFLCWNLHTVIEHRHAISNDFIFMWGTLKYVLLETSILFLAATANHNINYLKEWLKEYELNEVLERKLEEGESRKHDKKAFNMLWSQSSSTSMGLSFGYLCTITYGFLGTLLSIYVTYAVLQLQFFRSESSQSTAAETKPEIHTNVTSSLNDYYNKNNTE